MEKIIKEIKKYKEKNINEDVSKEILNVFLSDYPYEEYTDNEEIIDFINEKMHDLDNLVSENNRINKELNLFFDKFIKMYE